MHGFKDFVIWGNTKCLYMRLAEVEKGNNLGTRLLFKFISAVSGMRLPDAARIVMYYKDFYGGPMTAWTHPAMRGESDWSVGERELMAAMTAKWNSCAFCVQAHSGIASLVFDRAVVQAALDNFHGADIPPKLKTVLVFLEKMTLRPGELGISDARAVLDGGVSAEELEDAMAVEALFGITVRCADAFNFALLNGVESDKASKRMLAQGYAFGKPKKPPHPDHRAFAAALRRRILEGPGVTNVDLRQSVARRAADGAAIPEPFDQLVRQIGEAAYRVTDEQVKALVGQVNGEKAAFEIIVSAAVGAGLYRWDRGVEVLNAAMA
jgi:uncharacterized peroxidase-related enzyme